MKKLEDSIHEIAKECCIDYPNINDCASTEQLYAIGETIKGISLANIELHKVITKFMNHCDMTLDDYVKFIENENIKTNKSQAEEIEDQITKHYTYKDRYAVNAIDLAKHLKYDDIDSNEKAKYKNCGFDTSFDDSLTIFQFKDKSSLVVGSMVGVRAT